MMASKHEGQCRMKETEARKLAEEINAKKLRVLAEPISARHYGYWNIKLTYKPGAAIARTVTIMTAAEWAQFCEMWELQQQQKEGA